MKRKSSELRTESRASGDASSILKFFSPTQVGGLIELYLVNAKPIVITAGATISTAVPSKNGSRKRPSCPS